MKKKEIRREKERYDRVLGDRKVFEMTPEELEQPITKEMGELCRHRLEKRWFRRLIAINVAMIILVVGVFVANFTDNLDFGRQYLNQMKEEIMESLESEEEDAGEEETEEESADEEVTDAETEEEELTEEDIPFEVSAFFYGLFTLIITLLALYYLYAQQITMSLRITERNFPEVYQIIEDYSRRLGIPVPKAYVKQEKGVLNAFSAFLIKRQWICINAELFEVAYREHHDMDSLKFVIAHELAHIYYGHSTLHYNLLVFFAKLIPVVSSIASRTREYSCDRLAQRLTGVDGIEAMLVLVVDRHLYKMVDKEDYINEMRACKGFFVWYYNLLADHAIMSKRILALEEGRGSGALY